MFILWCFGGTSRSKASTDDFNVFALPSRLQNAVIRVYGADGNLIETH